MKLSETTSTDLLGMLKATASSLTPDPAALHALYQEVERRIDEKQYNTDAFVVRWLESQISGAALQCWKDYLTIVLNWAKRNIAEKDEAPTNEQPIDD